MTARTVLGVDAGGTKVHLRREQMAGEVLEDRAIEGWDWIGAGFDYRARMIAAIADHPQLPMPDAIGVGAHGCDSDAECEDLAARIRALVPAAVTVVNDAELFGRAVGHPDAINVVLGTGSIVVRRSRSGARYLGGWGWLVGDDGSAWGIVRNAVTALTDAEDADDRASDPLRSALLARSGAANLRELVDVMHREPASAWARWADEVFSAQNRGESAAASAVERGIAHTIGLVAHALDGDAGATVVFGGGVVGNQPEYAGRLRRATEEQLGVRTMLLDRPPVLGAVRLAADSAGMR